MPCVDGISIIAVSQPSGSSNGNDSCYWEADYDRPRTGRAQRWLDQGVRQSLLQMFGEIRQIGSFSNGEGVFERIHVSPRRPRDRQAAEN